jgi:hypothetical protein
MKIIDKTPLLDEKGELGILQRIQGMLTYGLNWPSELAAQKAIITFFDRQLEKGYTLIRNITLGQSGIMIPIILLGPAGIFVIQISYLRGRYQAKGGSWNVESGDGYRPAPVNLIQRTQRMARALKAFIERQGVTVPVNIEPVLIAGNPGLHIESERPAIRVMMIDGVKSFVSGLATGRPILSAEAVHDMTDRILNPRVPKAEPAPPPEAEPLASWEQEPVQPQVSRARAIFDAEEEAKPFNPADFDFAMVDEASVQDLPFAPRKTSPPIPLPRTKPKSRRILGMTPLQLAVVVALGLSLVCILVAGFVFVVPFFT